MERVTHDLELYIDLPDATARSVVTNTAQQDILAQTDLQNVTVPVVACTEGTQLMDLLEACSTNDDVKRRVREWLRSHQYDKRANVAHHMAKEQCRWRPFLRQKRSEPFY